MHTNRKSKQQFPAERILAIAPSNYGKSYTIAKWVCDQIDAKRWSPQRIVIFSRTIRSDPSMGMVVKKCQKKVPEFLDEQCFEDLSQKSEEIIMSIYSNQKTIKDGGGKMKPYLVIIDDCIGTDILTSKRGNLIAFATTARHYDISSIILLQAYRSSLSSVIRNQMTIVLIGRLSSVGETLDILEQYSQGCGKTKKEAVQKMHSHWEQAIQTNDNHGFLVIYTTRQFGDNRIQYNLDGDFVDTEIIIE